MKYIVVLVYVAIVLLSNPSVPQQESYTDPQELVMPK